MPTRAQTKTIQAIADLMVDAVQIRSLLGPEPWLHLDITLPQLKALLVIGARGPSRPSVIAEAIGVTPTSVTGILDRLEERDFTHREPDRTDRRATVVVLTEGGEAVLDEIYSSGREQLVEVLQEISEDDLAALQRGMTALVAGLRAHLDTRERTPASA